jgi:hypothetical protein
VKKRPATVKGKARKKVAVKPKKVAAKKAEEGCREENGCKARTKTSG